MSDIKTPLSRSLWNDVRRIADQIRVDVHLASMELKDKWRELEPKVQAIQRDFDRDAATAGAQIEGDLAKGLESLAGGLRKLAADLRGEKKETKEPAQEPPKEPTK